MPSTSKDYVIRVLASPAQVDADRWNALLAAQEHPSPFMRHEYLLALDQSGCASVHSGWAPSCIVLERQGELEAACCLYLKDHSFGEYVFDWAWARAYHEHGLSYYPKAVCAVPFTPVPGSRLLARNDDSHMALAQALIVWCQQQGLSSLHILFASARDRDTCLRLGMTARPTVQFHWTNSQPAYQSFDQFLLTLSQDKRKKIKQERRKVCEAGVSFRWARGPSITPDDWDFFYQCYARTYLEHGNPAYLNRAFFQQVASELTDHWLLFIAERAGCPIAASLIALSVHEEGIDASRRSRRVAYGRYWGCTERIDCLHFEACYYQPLQWCIEHGFDRFEGGAQGEHKLARALMPTVATSLHWMAHPAFADAVATAVAVEQKQISRYLADLARHSPFRSA